MSEYPFEELKIGAGPAPLRVPEGWLVIHHGVTGEQPVFIPAAALTGVGAATVTIDRVVERDGLLRLGWTTSGGAAADSYFRVVDPAGRGLLTTAVEDILPGGSTPEATTESEV